MKRINSRNTFSFEHTQTTLAAPLRKAIIQLAKAGLKIDDTTQGKALIRELNYREEQMVLSLHAKHFPKPAKIETNAERTLREFVEAAAHVTRFGTGKPVVEDGIDFGVEEDVDGEPMTTP